MHKITVKMVYSPQCSPFYLSLLAYALRGVTCICHDTGMCHYFGYFLGVAPGFLGIIFGYSEIFGYHLLVKFDFFKNNPDFVVLILIFPSMTLWNVAHRALVSYFLCRNVK